MDVEKILELAGVKIGDGEGEMPLPDEGIEDVYEGWEEELCQKIGPLYWDDVGEYWDMPITAALLIEWAKEHDCDLETVRVEFHPTAHILEHIIVGKKNEKRTG